MKNRFFKVLIFAVAVCIASSLLVGCGSSGKEAKNTATQAQEKASISVLLHCPDFPEQAQQMMDEFMKKNPNIEVDFMAMSRNPAEELQPKAAADALPDLMSINGDPFGAMLADEGKLADVSDTEGREAERGRSSIGQSGAWSG
jgi:ABC-type glycerol-3-phosphate transport system substrate-binding protein